MSDFFRFLSKHISQSSVFRQQIYPLCCEL